MKKKEPIRSAGAKPREGGLATTPPTIDIITLLYISDKPDHHDGDNLYVKKTAYMSHGDVGIFTIGNGCFLKELGADGLISRNKDHADIPGTEDVHLIGKMEEIGTEHRSRNGHEQQRFRGILGDHQKQIQDLQSDRPALW